MTATLSSFFAALLYNGRLMDPDPKNVDVEDAVDTLTDGRPVSVELEPGDGTYYHLLIVPCWAPVVRRSLGRFGVPRGNAHDYLIVTYLRNYQSAAFFAPAHVGAHDVPEQNKWSAGLVAWWLQGLWRALEADRAQLVRGSYEATEEAAQFAESIVGDLATQVEGDPDKIRRFWRAVRVKVDEGVA